MRKAKSCTSIFLQVFFRDKRREGRVVDCTSVIEEEKRLIKEKNQEVMGRGFEADRKENSIQVGTCL